MQSGCKRRWEGATPLAYLHRMANEFRELALKHDVFVPLGRSVTLDHLGLAPLTARVDGDVRVALAVHPVGGDQPRSLLQVDVQLAALLQGIKRYVTLCDAMRNGML